MDGTGAGCTAVDCDVCEALDTCAGVEPELIDAVEDGRQKSVLKITGPQVLSVFDSTTI